jgi:hypothetical protein
LRFRETAGTLLLLLSIISLFIGPIFYQWLRKGGFVAKAFDSIIVLVLLVMVSFLLIPESWETLGYWSVVLIFAGYLLPGLLEKLIKKAAHTLHIISLMLALAGLALHAMLDGAALTAGNSELANNLSLAIVLHRFGMGLMLWMMVQPVFGKRVGYSVIAFTGLATMLGYFLSDSILGVHDAAGMSVIQTLIIGMIVHSLIHRSHGETHNH